MISIIVPVFNSKNYIEECLNSILRQNYSDFEVLLIDDGSTDNSREILLEFCAKDNRFKYFYQKNQGVSAARNFGLSMARGEFITFIDSDDFVKQGFLRTLLDMEEETSADIIIGGAELFSNTQILITEDERNYFHIKMSGTKNLNDFEYLDIFCNPWGKLFKTEIIKKNSLLFPDGLFFEDVFWHWATFWVSSSVAFVPMSNYCYRKTPNGIMDKLYKKKYPGIAIHHLFVLDKVLSFAEKKGLSLAKRNFLNSLFEAYFRLAYIYAQDKEKPEIVNYAQQLIGKYTVSLEKNKNTQLIKKGRISDIDNYFFYNKRYILKTFKRKIRNFVDKSEFSRFLIYSILLPIRLMSAKFQFSILSSEETLKIILDRNLSFIRYGEGEFRMIYMEEGYDIGYQKFSPQLRKSLLEGLNYKNDDLLICVPSVFSRFGLKNQNYKSKAFWLWHVYHALPIMSRVLDSKRRYGDALITRPYIDYRNKAKSPVIFDMFKKLWQDKDILIVEGEFTRFGVGNDLLNSARSVHRVIIPAKNAFDKIQDVLEYLESLDCRYVLLSAGPAAKSMGLELIKKGVTVWDVGHLDIEYEWFLMEASNKINVPYKYVNEVDVPILDYQLPTDLDILYNSQIIKKIL